LAGDSAGGRQAAGAEIKREGESIMEKDLLFGIFIIACILFIILFLAYVPLF